MKIVHDPTCVDYEIASHPERPQRVSETSTLLQTQFEVPVAWARPLPCSDEPILRAHSPELLARLQIQEPFDEDTPWFEGLPEFARNSAAAALTALDIALSGENAFSLMRPPGHHATRTKAMGFCYLNNIAIAALEAVARGSSHVAVLDFDVHHGNGTEAILQDESNTSFTSIHEYPSWPDTGMKNVGNNCFNYPVPPQTHPEEYRHIFKDALEHIASRKPSIILVSAGFDCYKGDPLGHQKLEIEDYRWIGGMLRGLGIPVLTVLEGGYSHELPHLILAYLKGIEGT